MKMKQVCNSETAIVQINHDKRVFNYVLNDKRAKSKLLKGAKRVNNLEVEKKRGCVNLLFNDGSYFEVVLPLLRLWKDKLDEVFIINEVEIKIVEMDLGIEDSNKHMDTKLVIMANNDRLVVHAYNSRQNVMVQGKDYEKYAIGCFEPFFRQKIEDSLQRISLFNDNVKLTLGQNKSTKNVEKIFNCPQCGVTANSNCNLKVHIKSCHSKPSITSPPKQKALKLLKEDTISCVDMVEDVPQDVTTYFEDSREADLKMIEIEDEDINDKEVGSKTHDEKIVQKCPNTHELPIMEDLLCCYVCEFDTESSEELMKHKQVVHGQCLSEAPDQHAVKEIVVHDDESELDQNTEAEKPTCVTCAQIFETVTQYQNHECNHVKPLNIKCCKCEYTFKTKPEHEEHKEKYHVEDLNYFICNKCDFKSSTEYDLNTHKQSIHMNLLVDISTDEQNVLTCDRCKYKCRLNIQLKKHYEKKHINPKLYSCNECDYTTNFIANTWEHTIEEHPDKSMNLAPKEAENFLLKLVAEQNNDIIEDARRFKNDTKEGFDNLANLLETLIKSSDKKVKTLLDTVSILTKKVTRLETLQQRPGTASKTSMVESNSNKKQNKQLNKDSPISSSTESLKVALGPAKVAASTSTPRTPVRVPETLPNTTFFPKFKSEFLAKKKMLYIGDSVAHTASIRDLEFAQNCRIKSARAHSSIGDENSRWPQETVAHVVKQSLANPGRENINTLIMAAPTTDITNLDTSYLKQTDRTEDFQFKAKKSSQNMFRIAEESLEQNPSLQNVIIMEHHPRFDLPSSDPTSLKPTLAKLANAELQQLWLNSSQKERIFIGQHSLVTSGSGRQYLNRYRNMKTGQYDGIHLYGSTGVRDYTNSVKSILDLALSKHSRPVLGTAQSAELGTTQEDHRNCPQALYQRTAAYAGRSSTDHTKCPQAVYQHTQYHPSVQSQNRFELFNQGNY